MSSASRSFGLLGEHFVFLFKFIFECFDMLTEWSRKFLQWTLTFEIVHLKKRGALHFLNGCPDWDSNDENLLEQTMKICRCKKNFQE